MGRVRLFLENFFAYGLIGVLNKAVPLFMLPIITRLLPDTADFGRFDMYNMIVNFGTSFAVMGMYDAMFREFFEKDDSVYQKSVISTAWRIVLVSSMIITVLLLVFQQSFSLLFFGNNESVFLIIAAAAGVAISANLAIISAPTRMRNQRNVYIVSGLSQSLGYYGIAIMLIGIGFGYKSLIYANIISLIGVFLLFLHLNKGYFTFILFNWTIARELCKIGLPILPGFLIYWILESFDKIMIANMLGMKEVGIYSIGLKMASISQFIYMAFSGGWQYFAFSTMKDQDQVKLTSKVFEYLGICSFLLVVCVLPFSEGIFSLLFTGEYLKGNSVFPYLFLSPLLLMLYQTAANQLLVVKKTYYGIGCLAFGALVNVYLNFILIKEFGIKGSAFATLLGYGVSVLSIVILTVKMKLLLISTRFTILSLFMGILIGYLFLYNNIASFYFTFIFMGILFTLYRKEGITFCIKGLEHIRKLREK